jgi:hypothetical protein
VILGGAPPLLLIGVVRRWPFGAWWIRAAFVVALIVLLYAATPLGTALSRALAGT